MSANKILLLLTVLLAIQKLPAQVAGNIPTYRQSAPLFLSINGGGRVLPFQDGQMLQVGRIYTMQAVPDPGYVFQNWTAFYVNIQITDTYTDTLAGVTEVVLGTTNMIVSGGPVLSQARSIRFAVQPDVLVYTDSIGSLTVQQGWQANFVPRRGPVPFTKLNGVKNIEAKEP